MTETVKSVDKALRLLWEVHARPGISLTGLSTKLGLQASTALRLLVTLERHALVTRDPASKGFSVSPAVQALASGAGSPAALIAARLRPVARRLAETVHEQVSIAVLSGRSVEHVLKIDGAAAVGQDLILRPDQPRRDSNLNATALGKVFLSFAPDSVADDIIDNLTLQATATNTITDLTILRRHLDRIRRQKVAYSIRENTEHVSGVAAPILITGDHHCVAAIAVHGPSIRLRASRLRDITPLVRAAGVECARLLDPHPGLGDGVEAAMASPRRKRVSGL